MRNFGRKSSEYIVFLDECGDHTMDSIDRDFPLFLLSAVVVKRDDYQKLIIPEMAKLKLNFWDHEGVNLHSRDIRKAKGAFSFLQVSEVRHSFLTALSELMRNLPYNLFISAIRKDRHLNLKGVNADNPYELALEHTLDKLVHFMSIQGVSSLPFVGEARGKNEDQSLQATFYRMMNEGTSRIEKSKVRDLDCALSFRRKFDNIAGIQLADLCAHPCARKILQPGQTHRAFDVVSEKIHQVPNSSGWSVSP